MHISHVREAQRAADAHPAKALWLAGLLLAWQLPAQAQSAPVAAPAVATVPALGSAPLASPVSVPLVAPVVVDAVTAPPNTTAATAAVPAPVAPLAESAQPVGNSTQRLLALQRSGALASPVPRPVPGEIAQRSRERYLKSFEREIPERFQSSVSQKASSR